MWLVKWILAIPHHIVLAFLWIAFIAVTVVARFAILFTGRYPAPLFGFAAVILLFTGVYRLGLFNLLMGVNRWIYRVAAYAALMTDTYPPFRLDQGEADAPARRSTNG